MRAKIAQPTAKTLVTQLELVGLRGKLVGKLPQTSLLNLKGGNLEGKK